MASTVTCSGSPRDKPLSQRTFSCADFAIVAFATLLTLVPFAHAADFIPAVGVDAHFLQGNALVSAHFREVPSRVVADNMFGVLRGPRPQFVTEVTISAYGLEPGIEYRYHIHEKPIAAPGDCASAGEHWDPRAANPRLRGGNAADYKPTPGDWLTYEAGDFAGKYGVLTAEGSNMRRKWVLDPTIRLADFASLSLVVHGVNNERVACANLGRYVGRQRPIDSNDPFSGDVPLTARIQNREGPGEMIVEFREVASRAADPRIFSLLPPGMPRPNSVVQVAIMAYDFPMGTPGPFSYHIHERPLDASGSCESAGEHWDKLQVNPRFRGLPKSDYKPNPQDWTTYESGDLSGRFGTIQPGIEQASNGAQRTFFARFELDPTIHISEFSQLSMVVHKADSTRVGCANLAFGVAVANHGPNGPQAISANSSPPSGDAFPSTFGSGMRARADWLLLSMAAICGLWMVA